MKVINNQPQSNMWNSYAKNYSILCVTKIIKNMLNESQSAPEDCSLLKTPVVLI